MVRGVSFLIGKCLRYHRCVAFSLDQIQFVEARMKSKAEITYDGAKLRIRVLLRSREVATSCALRFRSRIATG